MMESGGPTWTVDTAYTHPRYTFIYRLGMASSGHIQDLLGLVGNFSLGILSDGIWGSQLDRGQRLYPPNIYIPAGIGRKHLDEDPL